MMFILRTAGAVPGAAAAHVKMVRKTPGIVPGGVGRTDYFCTGEAEMMAALRAGGCDIVELRDGWYSDDAGGGVAISGHGRYWEVRDTPFTVKEAVGPAGDAPAADTESRDHVNVRGAIFGV